MSMPRASIIATTYNQSGDLDLYLHSLRPQTEDDFEILIADDGSRPDTREVVERHRKEFFGDRLKHVWHEDVGYRKCKILNKAVHESSAPWLIFTDSDLIVHPRFVADHLAYAAPRTLFMGRRVELGPRASEWVRAHTHQWFTPAFYARIVALGVAKDTGNWKREFRIGSPVLARLLGCYKVRDLLGSNFSIDRELLVEINGFDESREHYWGEDGDLFVRARNSGAHIVGRKSYAVQFHLWHERRQPKPDAEADYRKQLSDRDYRVARQGLAQTER